MTISTSPTTGKTGGKHYRWLVLAVLTAVHSTHHIDRNVLSAPDRRVRLIGNFGVGFNHIDIDAARELGVRVAPAREGGAEYMQHL